MFAVEAGLQVVEPQRFAGTGLVDDQRGNTALGEPAGQSDEEFHFLGAVETVDLNEDRLRTGDAFGGHVERGKMLAFIRNFDTAAGRAGKSQSLFEACEKALIERYATL